MPAPAASRLATGHPRLPVSVLPIAPDEETLFDQLARAAELEEPRPRAPRSPGPPLATPPAETPADLALGTTRVEDRRTFELLSRRDNVPGVMGIREVKFLIAGVSRPGTDEAPSRLYFLPTRLIPYHYYYARDVLEIDLTNGEFNSQTYLVEDRRFIAGSLLAHDSFAGGSPDGETGLYTLEFWPTDTVRPWHVALAFRLVRDAMPFAAGRLAYHPSGETQRALYESERQAYADAGVRVVSTEELFGRLTYSALNPGEGYGLLRVLDGDSPIRERPPTVRDVVIFKRLPNDLSHVAGVLTEELQTPLSHINLKAKQNDTPNAFLKNASRDPRIAPLLGRYVYLRVTADDVEIREATLEEVEASLEALRPAGPQTPPRDLSRNAIADLDELSHGDLAAYGAKAANLGELRNVSPDRVPDGFAVPFALYDRFMRDNGFYDEAVEMIAGETFRDDPDEREKRLAKFRKRIKKKGEIAAADLAALAAMHRSFPPATPLRCRSSTNNEDLEGFNGAGLYDSFTHREDEGHIQKSIRQVWASLWNFRAFEEREFYRIDHLAAAMAVLVHPNFDEEKANGVAVTKNIYDPEWEGYYVNVQAGENLVTNPEEGAVPDELLVSRIGLDGSFEIQYVRRSNLVPPGAAVLTAEQIRFLVAEMRRLHRHFEQVYGRSGDPAFAMDLEFKVDADDRLVIKQARPWVD